MMKKETIKIMNLIGLSLMIFAVFANPFTIEYFLSPDKQFDYEYKYVVSQLISSIIFLIGLFTIKEKTLVYNKRKEILIFAIILLCLFGIEIILRTYYSITYDNYLREEIEKNKGFSQIDGEEKKLGEIISPNLDGKILYKLKPNLNVKFINKSVKTNSLGWRDQEFSLVKPSNTVRIAGVGDSVMFGWGVEEKERYMDLIEEQLNKKYPQKKWETQVFAAPGYNLAMEVEIVKDEILQYNPDLIIYGHIMNDHCLPSFLHGKEAFFSPRSYIYIYIKNILEEKKILSKIKKNEIYVLQHCSPGKISPSYSNLSEIEVYQSSLRELVKIQSDHKTKIVFFSLIKGDPRHFPPEELIWVDTTEELKNYLAQGGSREDLILSDKDLHPSPLAHRLGANKLLKGLEENKIIQQILSSSEY